MSLFGIESGFETIPVLAYDEIDSTNAEARRRAEAGDVGPLFITAAVQAAGRGRRGRAWDTSCGNLAATLLIITDASPGEAAQLSFVAAFAIRALAEHFVPASLVRFKWPNDVMVDGKKLSGILIESGRTATGALWLAIGMGVNLAHAPTNVERPATSIAAHLKDGIAAPPTPTEALAVLSEALVRTAAAWARAGFAPLRDEWIKGAAGIGQHCLARLDAVTVEGVAEGLDADGALLLRLPDRSLRRIAAGDVFFPEHA